jgi:hypothetical protein
MQPKQHLKLFALVFFLIWVAASPAKGAFTCLEGFQDEEVGSVYRICMPNDVPYNNKLIIWAHGFQDATDPVQIPEDQLSFGDFSIPEVITSLGYGFATNSYSKTGLAVRQGYDDILELVNIYNEKVGMPEKIFLTGASEGGLITALLIESEP